MHQHTLENWQHSHEFSLCNDKGERQTRYVLILTAITMLAEIIAGNAFGSMALLADGWHMATHVAAFLITLFAYAYTRKHANDPAYAFGTGKVNVLGGFASAVALGVVAFMMILESIERLVDPQAIQFNEAIAVAVLGLIINLVSAWLLKDDHHHHHGHSHGHAHEHEHDHHHEHEHHDHDDHAHHDHAHHDEHHHDHNLKAAYMHVLADALTSVLAIAALLFGKYLGWNWLDPMMGIVGAVIITRWAYGLVTETGPILLDGSINTNYQKAVKDKIEQDADNRVSDIHIWKVGANHYAAIIAIVTHEPRSAEHYKALLKSFHKLSHVTIEINQCTGEPCQPKA